MTLPTLRLESPGAAPERLLTVAEVAEWLNVKPKRVYELGIPAVRLSERSLRWRPSEVAQWIERRSNP